MSKKWLVHVFNILATIECLRAYEEAIDMHKLDFWDTNQVCSCPELGGTFVSMNTVGYYMLVSIACDVP